MVLILSSFWIRSRIFLKGYPAFWRRFTFLLIFGIESISFKKSPKLCFMTCADFLLNAKVVVDEINGIFRRIAAAFPQTAMESATIQSGWYSFISSQTFSPSANVVSTRIFVENATSFPILAASSGRSFCSESYLSQDI